MRNILLKLGIGVALISAQAFSVSQLLQSVKNGEIQRVEDLLESGANPNEEGTKTLKQAVSAKDVNIVGILLQYGADPDCVNNAVATPLFEATKIKHEGIARMLLQFGANPKHTDIEGVSPMRFSQWFSQDKEISDIYDAFKSSVSLREEGKTGSARNATTAMISLGACQYEVASEIMYELDASKAASVLLHALILERLREETMLSEWIEKHATEAVVHNMLSELGQRIVREEATRREIEVVWNRFSKQIIQFRDAHAETFVHYLARATRYSTYLRYVIRGKLETALTWTDEHDYSDVTVRDLVCATDVARYADNQHGAAMLQKARGLFICGLCPDVIDNILAFLPNTEDAAVEQQQ